MLEIMGCTSCHRADAKGFRWHVVCEMGSRVGGPRGEEGGKGGGGGILDIVAQPRTDISIAKLIARVLVSTGNKANIQKCVPRTDCDPSGHDAQCLQLKCRL